MNTTSQKEKLEIISSFCKSKGYNSENLITEITENLESLPPRLGILIDGLFETINRIEIGIDIGLIAIQLVGIILSLSGLVCPVVGIALNVVSLVALILKLIFRMCGWNATLERIYIMSDEIKHDLNGIFRRIKATEYFIDAFIDYTHVDKESMDIFISNVDIYIGIHELGNLRSRIEHLILGGKDEWLTAVQLLRWFVRLSTLRYSILYRFQICLTVKGLGQCIISTIRDCIENEQKENQTFLANIFLRPSLKNVGVIAIFDPLEERDIVEYLENLHLHVKDLTSMLHDQVFIVRPVKNQATQLGRPFFSISFVRSMKSTTGVRVRFRFTAIEKKSNLFYIKSPDLNEYVYMKENGKCKYAKMLHVPDNAQWRVILVNRTDKSKTVSSNFILCTKRWPEKMIYMTNTFFGSARGLENNSRANEDNLFMVSYLLHLHIVISSDIFRRITKFVTIIANR